MELEGMETSGMPSSWVSMPLEMMRHTVQFGKQFKYGKLLGYQKLGGTSPCGGKPALKKERCFTDRKTST